MYNVQSKCSEHKTENSCTEAGVNGDDGLHGAQSYSHRVKDHPDQSDEEDGDPEQNEHTVVC